MVINSVVMLDTFFIENGLMIDSFVSLINHSCLPNATIIFEGKELVIRALRTIHKNEEITINYCQRNTLTEFRKLQLQKRFFFDCICSKCTTPDIYLKFSWPSMISDLSFRIIGLEDIIKGEMIFNHVSKLEGGKLVTKDLGANMNEVLQKEIEDYIILIEYYFWIIFGQRINKSQRFGGFSKSEKITQNLKTSNKDIFSVNTYGIPQEKIFTCLFENEVSNQQQMFISSGDHFKQISKLVERIRNGSLIKLCNWPLPLVVSSIVVYLGNPKVRNEMKYGNFEYVKWLLIDTFEVQIPTQSDGETFNPIYGTIFQHLASALDEVNEAQVEVEFQEYCIRKFLCCGCQDSKSDICNQVIMVLKKSCLLLLLHAYDILKKSFLYQEVESLINLEFHINDWILKNKKVDAIKTWLQNPLTSKRPSEGLGELLGLFEIKVGIDGEILLANQRKQKAIIDPHELPWEKFGIEKKEKKLKF
ncbi:SET domain-containing protein ASCRUDRAFT_5929 [Ascoidea rubescens DSM 1968]|uniref:SET domain-containing protein n=1 Tax=Ascoidea rubescens DSM 1968 TaxID=1344418 RepID=A0A1D2VR05_9ASCO|nr:hypothetical protein ASCRUDRAFT_5929 [Ascoidea rubescens DSM 1968]ODV64046.1 hypothetical protein ASCRUDRAFT_5929 [Ascoidea rubescens DSM 1968]